jgi:hypothetical protein
MKQWPSTAVQPHEARPAPRMAITCAVADGTDTVDLALGRMLGSPVRLRARRSGGHRISPACSTPSKRPTVYTATWRTLERHGFVPSGARVRCRYEVGDQACSSWENAFGSASSTSSLSPADGQWHVLLRAICGSAVQPECRTGPRKASGCGVVVALQGPHESVKFRHPARYRARPPCHAPRPGGPCIRPREHAPALSCARTPEGAFDRRATICSHPASPASGGARLRSRGLGLTPRRTGAIKGSTAWRLSIFNHTSGTILSGAIEPSSGRSTLPATPSAGPVAAVTEAAETDLCGQAGDG